MAELWLLLLFGALTWYWLDGMRAKEVAVVRVRQACDQHNVQLLDETVAQVRLRLRRDGSGRVRLLRGYEFEFSSEGDQRSGGYIELLGRQVVSLQMEFGGLVLHDYQRLH